jgi:hypothetical protein
VFDPFTPPQILELSTSRAMDGERNPLPLPQTFEPSTLREMDNVFDPFTPLQTLELSTSRTMDGTLGFDLPPLPQSIESVPWWVDET